MATPYLTIKCILPAPLLVNSGQSFSVTEDVDLDEAHSHGPLTTGSCIELEPRNTGVTDIETIEMTQCQPEPS